MSEDARLRLFTEAEILAMYPISRTTLWKAREAGRLGYCRIGRKIVYLAEHIDAFIRSCERVADESTSILPRPT